MYTNVTLDLINQCLLNVVFSMPKAWNGQNSLKTENPASLNVCFTLFSTLFSLQAQPVSNFSL